MFENKSEATAPARLVSITDTLDPNLDLNTFELFEIAFASLFHVIQPVCTTNCSLFFRARREP